MNITILSLRGPTNFPHKGGAREYIKYLAAPWQKEGHKITLVCGIEKKYGLPGHEFVDGIEVIRIGKSGTPILAIWKYYWKHLRKSTDLLIENMVSFPMLSPMLAPGKNNTTIVHHLTGKAYWTTQSLPKAIIGTFMERVVLPVVYRRTKMVAVSELTRGELVHNGLREDRVEIIEPGVDNSYFCPDPSVAKEPLIFYIGRMGGVKKVDHLISAFKQLSPSYPELRLVVAGPGETEELKKLAGDAPVEFAGFLSEEQKRDLYRRAMVFASPSLREGFGITYVEANACGTPVVGYKIDGLATVADGAGIFVDSGDVDALADAMESIVADSGLRRRMEEAALASAARFSWKVSSRKGLAYVKAERTAKAAVTGAQL
ncbi:glycosyltransferase family 4 protein [Paenibacillus gansuensis]|uniref:Glycosyltransferase family 4 protein n=1 Tax=Paenibacillus gansuensis TaxID=306542 RepID=A0ABW5PAF2_9BACL